MQEPEQPGQALQHMQLQLVVVGQAVQHRPQADLQQGFGNLLAGHHHLQALLSLLDCGLVGACQLLEKQLDDVMPQLAQLTLVPAQGRYYQIVELGRQKVWLIWHLLEV